MITKTYYLDRTVKGFRQKIEHIKKAIPCFYSAKPVEMDFLECSFQVHREDVSTFEKMIAPLV